MNQTPINAMAEGSNDAVPVVGKPAFGHSKSVGHVAELRAAKRKRDMQRQIDSRTWVGDCYVCLAIGKTGGVDNVGWEIHPPAKGGRVWFQMTKDEAIARIPYHREFFKKHPHSSEDGDNT